MPSPDRQPCVYNDIDKVVLSHFGMNRANGIYSMAYRCGQHRDHADLGSSSAPHFLVSSAKASKASLRLSPWLEHCSSALLWWASGSRQLMFLCAPIIPHLVGKSFAESVSALRWLCLIPFFRCFHLSAGDAIAGAGHQKSRLISQSIAAIGNLLLNFYLVPRYSWQGAAWASLVTDGSLGVDELAGADLSQQAFGALAADNSELAVITILMFDPF